jgi:hypothetical protein
MKGSEESVLPAEGAKILRRKLAMAKQGEPVELIIGLLLALRMYFWRAVEMGSFVMVGC